MRELSIGDRVGRLSRSHAVLPASPPLPGGGWRPPRAPAFAPASPAATLLETLTIIGLEELPGENVPVYNFHVAGDENYFAEGVLVHNKPCAF